MQRDTKEIVKRLASAIAATVIFNPAEMREAAHAIRDPDFTGREDAQEVIAAFAALLEKNAEKKDRILRRAFQPGGIE